MRKRYGDKLQAKVVLAALRNEKTRVVLLTECTMHRDLVLKREENNFGWKCWFIFT